VLRGRGASSEPFVEGKDIRKRLRPGRRAWRFAIASAFVALPIFFSPSHAARAEEQLFESAFIRVHPRPLSVLPV
jgi:hypothetical protein